ncbi:uncharacterized protein LOC125497110 isoform X1 [Beta vulgaris subsp. vulgaris]|uniref:uncharacterized protein LOC125497110 isoform X1 n=2 Tax=Beta vulgaris subsp. vulgaris TaxID=3555 RepID=UPI00254906C2|nr:uncharacterized protein LOC125497110 isoform X1 [Beta vulgaris subsp. vulgaris]
MPTSATTNRPEDLIFRLTSPENQTKFKALRELKNQIIGNRTKKLSYVKIGVVVPAVVKSLCSSDSSVIVQASAVIGSFACGVDAGAQAVLDAGAFSLLFGLISHSEAKVVDAAARSLKMIYQSKLAPKYDFLSKENICFLTSLLNSESENLTGLGATIITHSCQITEEQKVLCEAGILKKLLDLLHGSLSQRDASLEALAAVIRNNPDVNSEFVEADNGRAFRVVCELTKDKLPRTRLLASMCLIAMWNTSPCHLQDVGLRTKLIHMLIELLDDPGQVGDEAPFALSCLITGKEDLQKLALEADVIDKLSKHLRKDALQAKRLQGIFLALADVCSKLEVCRAKLLSLEVLKLVADALNHDCSEVQIAACMCLRSVSRSVKNLSAGVFMNELIVIPLIHRLNDASAAVQVAALSALSNVVVEFTTRKSIFLQYGGVKQLVHLSTSMDSTVRLKSLWVLKNLIFLADNQFKEGIFLELTPSTLWSLICDHDPAVQEQAICFVSNLVDGCVDSIEYVFTEEAIILQAIGRQLRISSKSEVCIQGMYVLANVATGNEFHKEAVLQQLLPSAGSDDQSVLIKLLQSSDDRLRTATVWTVVNLTFPSSPGAYGRLVKLRSAGVYSQIKNMANDSCLDVKLRVRTALGQSMTFADNST